MTTTIAFYFESENYRWMAEVAIASAHKAMPDAKLVQLSPDGVAVLRGVDHAIYGKSQRMARLSFLGRYFALADEVRGNLILANCDLVFLKSVEHVFDMPGEWSIAAPHIASREVRFDGGVFFARDTTHAWEFWEGVRAHDACRSPDKPVTQQLSAFNERLELDATWGRVRVLPGVLYSYVPKNEFDPATGAYIVHARGPRKKWLCHYAGLPAALGTTYLETYERFLPKGPTR